MKEPHRVRVHYKDIEHTEIATLLWVSMKKRDVLVKFDDGEEILVEAEQGGYVVSVPLSAVS